MTAHSPSRPMDQQVIVRLKGGLGNQLFQYAIGRAFSLRNGYELLVDRGWYDRKGKNRNYKLGAFHTSGKSVSLRRGDYRLARCRAALPFNRFTGNVRYLQEPAGNGYRAIGKLTESTVYFDGYWQSARYFEDIRDTLLQDLESRQGLPEGLHQPTEKTVAVHVRRGDYVAGGDGHVVSEAYIRCAMGLFDNSHDFLFFSDDPDWCRSHFDGSNVRFSNASSDIDDLVLMSRAPHNIIANSSFSWWAAWLNPNAAKKVIAPQPWTPTGTHTDIVPVDWVKLPISG